MFVIAGLGNPKREYENTRHNAGFDVIDKLSEIYQIPVKEEKFKAMIGMGIIEGQKVLLAKPLTFMNLSGESIRAITDYYNIDVTSELVVISDDISLAEGMIRVRKKGSAGGHNGLKSIIAQLGTDQFQRIKMGVGEKPQGYDLADYVLGHFSKEDRVIMDAGIHDATEAIKVIVTDGIDMAMNRYNKKNTQES